MMYSHCNYTCLILSHWKHTCFGYVFLSLIADMTTTLLSSVPLLVHSTSYNANSNKRLILFFFLGKFGTMVIMIFHTNFRTV